MTGGTEQPTDISRARAEGARRAKGHGITVREERVLGWLSNHRHGWNTAAQIAVQTPGGELTDYQAARAASALHGAHLVDVDNRNPDPAAVLYQINAAGITRAGPSMPADPGPLDLLVSPWDAAGVASLNGFQRHDMRYHPFTCGNPDCPGRGLGEQVLAAGADEWMCPARGCGYRQFWAYRFMIDGSWQDMSAAEAGLLGAVAKADRIPLARVQGGPEQRTEDRRPTGQLIGQLAALTDELTRRLRQYETAITWDTTCTEHGVLLDAAYADRVRIEQLQEVMDAQSAALAAQEALIAAYQADPGVERRDDRLVITALRRAAETAAGHIETVMQRIAAEGEPLSVNDPIGPPA